MFSKNLQLKAESGDLEAILDIANSYFKGAGTKIDREKAFEWYSKALEIDANNVKTLNGIGDYYCFVVKDYEESIKYYIKAAEYGDNYALCSMGAFYLLEKKDYDKSIEYYEKAARLQSLEAIDCLYEAYSEKYDEITTNIKYIEFLRMLAAAQNPFAMIRLYDAYTEESIAPRDENTAMYYLNQAVSMNCPTAISMLASAYSVGDVSTIGKDISKANVLWQKAADLNDGWALSVLAHNYHYGQNGFETNEEKAKEYYERCIEIGENCYAQALTGLGILLHKKSAKEQDKERSANLLQVAADCGNNIAQFIVGGNYETGYFVPMDINKAIYYYTESAKQDNSDSQYKLGRLLVNGALGAPVDQETAVKLFERASQHGDYEAMEELGICAYEGKGMPVDKNRARMLFENCAREGLPQSQYDFALMNYQGEGGPANYKAAEYWYKKAIESDIDVLVKDAKWDLALMYSNNTQEYEKAFPLWTEFAKKGNADAQYNLGLFYAKGWAVPQDDNIAKYWFGEAAKQENPDAIEVMEIINNNNYIPDNNQYGNRDTSVDNIENKVKADVSIFNKILILTTIFFVLGFITVLLIAQDFLVSLIGAYFISVIPLSIMRLKGLKMSSGQAVMTAAAGYFANRENGCTFALAFMLGRWLMNYLVSAVTLPYWYIKSVVTVINANK